MNTNYSNASMLDMVFEHRYKAYGAYVLRRDANKTTRNAMLFILSTVTLFCFGNFIKESMRVTRHITPIETVANVTDINKKVLPPAPHVKPVQPPKPPQTAAALPTIANTDKKVVADSKATMDSIPSNKDMANIEPGIKTNLTANNTGIGITDGTGTDKIFEVAKQAALPAPSVLIFAEQMPEFPGGDKALMEFIARNVDYPRMERDNDIAGKVITQFTVNEDGTVSDIQILRSPSSGFNKEASRVIKMLPAFKPGLQQGKAVRVRFNLPIIFKLN